MAIFQTRGARADIEALRRGAEANKDGAGYAFVENGKVEIRRSLSWKRLERQFTKDVDRCGATSPFLIHFRIATHGTVSKENCHPFRMADGGAVIHNGVIGIPNIPKGWSDTRYFIKKIIDQLPPRWEFEIEWTTLIYGFIGWSKMVFLWPDGRHLILGESSGHWEKVDEKETVWYSNNSCQRPFVLPLLKAGTSTPNTGDGNSAKCGHYLCKGDICTWPNHPPSFTYNPVNGGSWASVYGTSRFRQDPEKYVEIRPNVFRQRSWAEQQEYRQLQDVEDYIHNDKKNANSWMVDLGGCPDCAEEFDTRALVVEHMRTCAGVLARISRARHGRQR